MPYEFSYDADTSILTSRVSGLVDKSLVKPLTTDMHEETVKHKCRLFLNDYRNAYIDISTIEVYGLPQLMEAFGTNPSARHAVVVKGETELVRFFETVSKNRGKFVEVFTDIDKARDWLKS